MSRRAIVAVGIMAVGVLGGIIWGVMVLMPEPLTPERMRARSVQLKLGPSAEEQKRLVKDEVKNALEFQFTWTTGGFGTVLMLDITIDLTSSHRKPLRRLRQGLCPPVDAMRADCTVLPGRFPVQCPPRQ